MEAKKMKNDILVTDTQGLISRLRELASKGGRLSAITGVDLGERLEVIYSVDVAYTLHNVRIEIEPGVEHISVNDIFNNAWMPENELSEMFDVKIQGIKGQLLLTDEDMGKAPLRKSTRIEVLKGGF
jgi:NADH:ubiquinone oxidoreductase subunit C